MAQPKKGENDIFLATISDRQLQKYLVKDSFVLHYLQVQHKQ